MALSAGAFVAGTGGAVAYAAITQLSRGLPSPDRLGERQRFQTTRIYDRNGVLLYELFDPEKGKRRVVPLRDIPVPVRGTTGLTGAAPIWHAFMEAALLPLPVDPLAPPPGLQRLAIGRDSGELWTESCSEPRVEEYFFPGTAPDKRCEQPSPTPAPTVQPAPYRPPSTTTPRATWTPAPSVAELRERAAGTATAAAERFATRIAEIQASRPAVATPTPPCVRIVRDDASDGGAPVGRGAAGGPCARGA
ncbi:MAG: hypothetical protein HY332_12920 [Chloroflexi bacterium]|nr:hypothetical protein [Chloroflexota bacterium]